MAHGRELRRLPDRAPASGPVRAGRRLRPGTITAGLAGRVAPGRVVAADSAEAVLDEARRNTASLDNVEVAVADVHALDFADGTFDIVHAHQVLQHIGDPVHALREMRRVTRPGGLVAVREADFGTMIWYPEPPGMDAWLPVYYRVARGTAVSPTPGAAWSPGPAPPASPTSPPPPGLVLRHPGGARVVERVLGRAPDPVVRRRPRRGRRACHPGRAPAHLRGVEGVGGRRGRLVLRHPRRDHRSGLSPRHAVERRVR